MLILLFGRYVISNACHKDLCYKQKGTDFVFRLGVGEHAHLHWTDATRLLHCIVADIYSSWS